VAIAAGFFVAVAGPFPQSGSKKYLASHFLSLPVFLLLEIPLF
jgi:hypothetical protein